MSTPEHTGTVVVLDFRTAEGRPADQDGLRETVAARLRARAEGEPGPLCFLVVDTPSGLTDNTAAYELLMRFPARGAVPLVCLAVGELPAPPAVPGRPRWEEDGSGRRLRLMSGLRTASAGVLWAADPAADDEGPGGVDADRREAALGVLVDLLCTPEVFHRVLGELRHCPASTAAPALRVLEHDLSPAARDRAWENALSRFTGEDARTVAGPEARLRDLPARLAELVGGGPRFAADGYRVPGGPADEAHRACAEALRRAERAHSELASAGGLTAGPRAAGRVPAAIGEAARGLRRYRDLVEAVLRDSGAPGIGPGEAARRLADAGVELPAAETHRTPGAHEADPADDGLNRFALRMLDEGLDLHTVAGRLTALSEQVAPMPAAGRLPELERACPEPVLRSVTASNPFRFAAPTPGTLASAAVLALLGSLWPWPGTALAVLPLGVLFSGHLLAARTRPNRAAGGGVRMAGGAQAGAALLGVAGGRALGQAAAVPAWAALGALAAATLGAVLLVLVRWTRAVDDWWDGTGMDRLGPAPAAVDRVLADAVRQQWWAAAERTRCADGARSLAGALRAAVAPAEPAPAAGEADGDWDADGWDTEDWDGAEARWTPEDEGAPPPAAGPAPQLGTAAHTEDLAPAWLDRGAGEGGPDLTRTLVGDLSDATADALRRQWAAPEEAVRRGIEAAHRNLRHNGVAPVPSFARRDRRRGDPLSLLGVGPRRVREALAPEAAGRALQTLCSPRQSALLSRDPAAARLVRFAPDAVRALVEYGDLGEAEGAAESVVWTSSGRFVGALGLTPLRAGVVETVWIRADEDVTGPVDRRDGGGSTW